MLKHIIVIEVPGMRPVAGIRACPEPFHLRNSLIIGVVLQDSVQWTNVKIKEKRGRSKLQGYAFN
jgi:hypothetical protein